MARSSARLLAKKVNQDQVKDKQEPNQKQKVSGSKKRQIEEVEPEVIEIEDEDDESEIEDIKLDGLIDDEASEDEDEEEDSDAEFNKLLAEEGDDEELEEIDNEDYSESEESEQDDSKSITDKISGMKIRTLSSNSLKSLKEIKTTYTDGSDRILKPEIEPVYDSDDSDREDFNTIGNVPISAYEEYPHIGYDINGKRIMRPAKGSALEKLLESIELPEGWTGLLDQNTGGSLNISEEELELIRKIEKNENTNDSTDPYEPTIEWFTSKTEVMPLTAIPEPKRRFVPSKHEAKRIMKIVKAIREGRIMTPEEKKRLEKEQDEKDEFSYDLWDNTKDEFSNDHIMNLRAPKLPPPTNEESYNPPEEYLLTEEEKKQWEELEPSEREKNFIPAKYGALRKVPGYQESVRERFERCLDLYLAPRVRRNKLNIDPESLVPELPSPKDLRPFPIRTSTIYEGHEGRIRTLSVHPSGLWLATGSDDGTVRIWEVLTGREVYKVVIVDKVEENPEDHIESIAWNPQSDIGLLAISCADSIYLIVPPIFGYEIENNSRLKIESGWGYAKTGSDKTNVGGVNGSDDEDAEDEEGAEEDKGSSSSSSTAAAKWLKPTNNQVEKGISAVITTSRGSNTSMSTIKKISWHRRGDYFVTVSPDGGNRASVLIHQLSKHASQSPFRKAKGIIMDAKFHPTKPNLIVMSQRYIRIYNLQQQQLDKKLLPGARWLSCLDIHPRGGDHILAGSYDKRVLWHDLDLSNTPYKTLRYHEKAVRGVSFHKGGLPLFCSASDDGSIHVFHATVYDDLLSNPLLVPLKKLTGHKVSKALGVLDVCWHPREAWLFSAGADGTARLWTN